MPARYFPASPELISIVDRVIMAHHDHLLDAKIGILFRDEAPNSNGRVTLGQAKKVGELEKALLKARGIEPFDFIIWFADDMWERLNETQRVALVDHELCHCGFTVEDGQGKARMISHEVEEFNCILARYGLWWPGGHVTQQALSQAPLPFEEVARPRLGIVQPAPVEALELEKA